MARTIYFADGSREVLFCGNDPDKQADDLERIIRERLGDDAASFLREILSPEKNGRADLEWELKSYEGSCESYRDTLQEVLDELQASLKLLSAKRIDRKQLTDTVSRLITRINIEL